MLAIWQQFWADWQRDWARSSEMRLFSSSAMIEKRLYAIHPALLMNLLLRNRTDVCQEFGWNLREEFHASLVITAGRFTYMYVHCLDKEILGISSRHVHSHTSTFTNVRWCCLGRYRVRENCTIRGEDEPAEDPFVCSANSTRLRFYLPIAFHFGAADRIKSRYLRYSILEKYWQIRLLKFEKIAWYSKRVLSYRFVLGRSSSVVRFLF